MKFPGRSALGKVQKELREEWPVYLLAGNVVAAIAIVLCLFVDFDSIVNDPYALWAVPGVVYFFVSLFLGVQLSCEVTKEEIGRAHWFMRLHPILRYIAYAIAMPLIAYFWVFFRAWDFVAWMARKIVEVRHRCLSR